MTPQEVIEFWLGPTPEDRESVRSKSKDWYNSTADLDRTIRDRFGAAIQQAAEGDLAEWESTPEGALGLVLLLDQFSRNAYRGNAGAFASDRAALAIAKRAIEAGFDREVPTPGRAFFYHPFEHSESVTEQNRSVLLFETLAEEVVDDWRDFAESCLDYARDHRDVVVRFGRFPHRNEVMRRASSGPEMEYLETASGYGQKAGTSTEGSSGR